MATSVLLAWATAGYALNPDRRADAYSIFSWSSDRGLPSDKVRGITQARDGYLWIATAQGIARFDGQNFTNFTGATNPELRGGGFFCVIEAADGTLWFGGDNGLFCWRGGRFQRFTTADGLANNYVRALALTREGDVVACTRTGYSFVRGGRIETPGAPWRATHGVARSYLDSHNGTTLLGTDEGLWRVDGATATQLSGRDGLPAGGYNSLIETKDGSTWIGHSTGVRRIRSDGTVEDYGPAQGLTKPRVSSIRADRDGNIWIVTSGGLYRWKSGQIEHPAYAAAGVVGASLQQLYEDREGAVWIAAAPALFRLTDNMASTIGAAEGLGENAVYAVTESHDGTWWIGLWTGGLYRYDQKKATRVSFGPGGPEQVLALAESPEGTLWIGALSGLYRYAGSKLENFFQREHANAWRAELAGNPDAVLPGIAHNRANSIVADGAGGVWVGTDGALYHTVPDGFRAYTHANGLLGDVVKSVLRASNGDLWVSTPPLGVSRLHDGKWIHYRCRQELGPEYPRAIYEDAGGDIWVATDGGGVNRFHDGHWRNFTTQDGLADDFITGLVEDQERSMWLAFPRGVMRITREELDAFDDKATSRLKPRVFGRSDGLPAGETNQQGSPSMFRVADGRLLVATDRGVAVIEPRKIPNLTAEPPLYIERVLVNGVNADVARPITIAPGPNDVEIQYTAVETLAPEKLRFRIRLKPLDADWVPTGARRDVRYSKLPPGHYEFSVAATSNMGSWSSSAQSIEFTVQPFFYQTTWFTAGVPVGFVFVTVLAFWGRSRLARRRLLLLQQRVDERTHALQLATARAESAVLAKSEVIAELEHAQADTARERARFKFIFDAVPIGLSWMRRGEPSTRLVNAAFSEITGIPIERSTDPEALRGATHPHDLTAEAQQELLLAMGDVDHYTLEKRFRHADGTVHWVVMTVRLFRAADGGVQEITSLVEITGRKDAEARLADTNKQLVDISRQAGMAEIATGVLHNVGNVLNSVNVSASVLVDLIKRSKIDRVAKLSALLQENQTNLATFIASDPRGQRVPEFLQALAEHLKTEQGDALKELESLQTNVAHIKEIVAMQQSYARVSGVLENVPVVELIEHAIRINAAALQRHGIQLVRTFPVQPSVITEKHRIIQILVNLIQNAKFAIQESGRTSDRRIEVRIEPFENGVAVHVIDNGVGIPAENLTRIFGHGFTTRKHGHGFGLHSGALAAKELGGSLTVESEGPGKGAAFTLFILNRSEQPKE